MKIFGPLLVLTIIYSFIHTAAPIAHAQDYRGQIDLLLKSAEKEDVEADLTIIAEKSANARSQVIEAMISVLKTPVNSEDKMHFKDYRWTTAVKMLGRLRAKEAIDVLVKNLDKTGEYGFISTTHYQPVSSALAKIGEPAIPRLIEGLSDETPRIRLHAASTLARIGIPALTKLKKVLQSGGADLKYWAAITLAWIGGKEARMAIERAIEKEKDPNTVMKLKDALESVGQ